MDTVDGSYAQAVEVVDKSHKIRTCEFAGFGVSQHRPRWKQNFWRAGTTVWRAAPTEIGPVEPGELVSGR